MKNIGDMAVEYMRDSMAMPHAYDGENTDQQQNWIAGHMTMFAASIIEKHAGGLPLTAPQAYHDLQIGIRVRDEFAPGGLWKRKDGTGIPMSFSLHLLAQAGGIRKFLAEYTPEFPS